MTIWILALILIGGVGALGRQIGATRMGITLLGTIIAYVGALFLSPLIAKYLPAAGIKNPVSVWLLAPVISFFALFIFMCTVSQGVYSKVSVYWKFRAKDDARMRWERLDINTGLSLGIATGCLLLMIVSVPIYVVGQVTAQLESPSGNPFYVTAINKARRDLNSTGFDKVAAALSPNTDQVFSFGEVVGLLYHNKSLREFLQDYPLYYTLVESEDLAKQFTDPEFASLIDTQANVIEIFKSEKTAAIIGNDIILGLIKQTDLKDLQEFLKTGKSPLYVQNPMVGKWRIQVLRSGQAIGAAFPKLPSASLRTIRGVLGAGWKDLTLVVAPDGTAYFKGGKGNFPNLMQFTQFRLTPEIIQSITLRGKPELKLLSAGTWSGGDDALQISLEGKGGKGGENAKMDRGYLQFNFAGFPLVFYKFL